jgi:polyisoprenoid-binding protein YceI
MQSWRKSYVVLAASLVASGILGAKLSNAQAVGVYEIDAKASRVEIHVFRAGTLSGLGDDHEIQLTRFSGRVSRTEGESWQVHVVGEAGSLVVLDRNLSDSARREVQETMLGASQLDVSRYPRIEIKSRSVAPGGAAGSLLLEADLTLHGVTRAVAFPLAWSQSERRLSVKGRKQLFLRDFGIQPIRKFFGTIQVRNDFEIVYDIKLDRHDGAPAARFLRPESGGGRK